MPCLSAFDCAYRTVLRAGLVDIVKDEAPAARNDNCRGFFNALTSFSVISFR
jgi:hypothetical protein